MCGSGLLALVCTVHICRPQSRSLLLQEAKVDHSLCVCLCAAGAQAPLCTDGWHPEEVQKWEFGRRKLAAIMGEEEGAFTEREVQKALRYLLPTRLSARDARPLMKVSLGHTTHAIIRALSTASLPCVRQEER